MVPSPSSHGIDLPRPSLDSVATNATRQSYSFWRDCDTVGETGAQRVGAGGVLKELSQERLGRSLQSRDGRWFESGVEIQILRDFFCKVVNKYVVDQEILGLLVLANCLKCRSSGAESLEVFQWASSSDTVSAGSPSSSGTLLSSGRLIGTCLLVLSN